MSSKSNPNFFQISDERYGFWMRKILLGRLLMWEGADRKWMYLPLIFIRNCSIRLRNLWSSHRPEYVVSCDLYSFSYHILGAEKRTKHANQRKVVHFIYTWLTNQTRSKIHQCFSGGRHNTVALIRARNEVTFWCLDSIRFKQSPPRFASPRFEIFVV